MAITLGIDVGHTSLKAVAVSSGRVPSVLWSVRVPREGSDLAERLRALRAAAKGPFDQVVSALSSDGAMALLVPLPFSNPKLVDKAISVEVEGFLSTPIEGQELAHQVVSVTPQGSMVLAGLAPTDSVRSDLDALTLAGLEPRILDLDLAALWTCGAALRPAAGPLAVVDVGAHSMRVVVLSGDALSAARVIPGGGDAVTESIAARFGLDPGAAEIRKLETLARTTLAPRAEPAAGEGDVHSVLVEAYEALAEDIALTLRSIEHRQRITVERVLLVGGASRARGFDQQVQEHTGLPCEVPQPPEGSSADPAWWPDGAIAYGLALRAARGASAGSTLNFRRGSFAYGRDVRELTRRAAPLALPISAILIAGLVSLTVRYVQLGGEAKRIRAAVNGVFQRTFPNEPIQDPEIQIRRHIQELDKKLAVLASAVPPAEVMRVISASTPSDLAITLDGLTIEGNRATIEGHTDRFESIERLKTSLENVDPFGGVRVQDQAKDGPQVRFTMVLELAQDGDEEASS